MSVWCTNNKHTINIYTKNKIMCIPRNEAARATWEDVNIAIADVAFRKVKVHRYLGVDLDEHFTVNTNQIGKTKDSKVKTMLASIKIGVVWMVMFVLESALKDGTTFSCYK